MRSILYGILLTLSFSFAENVQAASDLNGKALFCESKSLLRSKHAFHGLTFDKFNVTRHQVDGYSIVRPWINKYKLEGTGKVAFRGYYLDRVTLKTTHGDICLVSSIEEITQKLNEIIATAKKKNKF